MPGKKPNIIQNISETIPDKASGVASTDAYPANVVDRHAYDEFQEQRKALYSVPDNPFIREEYNLNVNLLMPIGNVRRAVEHAPEHIRDEVEEIVKGIQTIKNKMSKSKRKAMGMTRKKFGHRDDLTIALEARKAEIIDLFGMYYSLKEVHSILNIEWKYDISLLTLRKFYGDNKDVISQKRDLYVKTATDIRLGHKRSRLEELSYLYRSRKNIYKGSQSRADSMEARAILADIRKEVEGERLIIEGEVRIRQDSAIDMHVHKLLMDELSIKTIIIARVAAKLQVNPLILMERLATSYYSKYNGFAPAQEGEEVVYPSQMIYDFDRMTSGKTKLLKDELSIQDATIIDEKKKDGLDKLKSELMKKLISRKNKIRLDGDD